MKEVSSNITYNGKDYKIVFNLNVMEAIQEEFETLDKWGELTDGKSGEVNIKALLFGFREMLNEGIDIENEKTNGNTPFLTHKQVGRILTEVGTEKITNDMNDLVVKSTKDDLNEENEKNA